MAEWAETGGFATGRAGLVWREQSPAGCLKRGSALEGEHYGGALCCICAKKRRELQTDHLDFDIYDEGGYVGSECKEQQNEKLIKQRTATETPMF